jgi:uncharacterized protein YeaO (DUF488 family)
MAVRIERVYDSRGGKGARFLVERLWPRGIKKEELKMNAWLKDVAPSTELREWFNHDLTKWSEFQRRYTAELGRHPAAWQPLLDAARLADVTLLYSARDTEHNSALLLKQYLEAKLKAPAKTRHA